MLDKEELAAIEAESNDVLQLTHVIDVRQFDPVLVSRYFIAAPKWRCDLETFQCFRDALIGLLAIGSIVINHRQLQMGVTAYGRTLLAASMHALDHIRSGEDVMRRFPNEAADTARVSAMRHMLAQHMIHFDPRSLRDSNQEALAALVRQKAAGKRELRREVAHATQIYCGEEAD